MEAIVLAGGLGSRLRQVVNNVPKSMAPIAGRPFLKILLGLLARKGFSRIILSLGFMAENIFNYFGSHFSGLDLVYVVEKAPLDTGGATRHAIEACTQNYVFIFNGDTFLDLEIEQLKQQWQKNQNLIVVGRHVVDTSRYGRLVVDGTRIVSLVEKGVSNSGLINAGCYVMTTDALARFPLNKSFSIEKDYLIPEIARTNVEVFVTKGMFVDIGYPEDYVMAQTLLANV